MMSAKPYRLRRPTYRSPPVRRGGHHGFTILEVLVVVAIISLLAAILLPSLRGAREQARRVTCQSNLRHLSIAWHHYLEAHEGRFLRGINANINYGGKQGSYDSLFQGPKPLNRYLDMPLVAEQGAQLFMCPSDRGAGDMRPSFFECLGTSYDANPFLIGQNSFYIYASDPCKEVLKELRRRMADLKRSQITNEPRVILMGDFGWVEAASFKCTTRLEWHRQPFSYNIAFMDGHASFIRIRKGLHTTSNYTTIPYEDLQAAAAASQVEVN